MKTAQQAYSRALHQSKPTALAAVQLTNIKIKDYTLIGYRDLEAEQETTKHLDFLDSKFLIPRLYTLISQNRKISITETLSNSNRLFLNFESFKWSELFFTYFRQVIGQSTEHFVFQNLLYSLDIYISQYQLMVLSLKANAHTVVNALHRRNSQLKLVSMIHNHPAGENLCLLFILDLLLISVGKAHYSSASFMMTQAEAIILLNYFSSQELITVECDKLNYFNRKMYACLKKFSGFRGQILFTDKDKNKYCENQISNFENIFLKNEAVLEQKTFETCFTHI